MAKTKSEKLDAKRGDKPDKIVRITKEYMRDYIKYQANTEENVKWFINLCKSNTVDKMKDGKTYKDIDLSKVRKEFVEKFFPKLIKKESNKTFLEELDDFFAEK